MAPAVAHRVGHGDTMIDHEPSVYQTNRERVCGMLRAIVVDGVRAGRGTPEGIGSPLWRVSTTLYALLLAHSLDERGRCRSCRPHGAWLGRRRLHRRRCRVDREASFWLGQQDRYLASQAAHRWGLTEPPPPTTPTTPAGASHALPQGEPTG